MLKSILIIILIDIFFLKLSAKHFNKQVKVIQGTNINLKLLPTILAYIFLGVGHKYFILDKNENHNMAFLLGLVIYGTYESTNMAIFDKWNIKSFIIDTIWGAVLFYLATFIIKCFPK